MKSKLTQDYIRELILKFFYTIKERRREVWLHFFEPPSKFDFVRKFCSLTFENIKDSVIVVRHENAVYYKFGELYQLLEELRLKIF